MELSECVMGKRGPPLEYTIFSDLNTTIFTKIIVISFPLILIQHIFCIYVYSRKWGLDYHILNFTGSQEFCLHVWNKNDFLRGALKIKKRRNLGIVPKWR